MKRFSFLFKCLFVFLFINQARSQYNCQYVCPGTDLLNKCPDNQHQYRDEFGIIDIRNSKFYVIINNQGPYYSEECQYVCAKNEIINFQFVSFDAEDEGDPWQQSDFEMKLNKWHILEITSVRDPHTVEVFFKYPSGGGLNADFVITQEGDCFAPSSPNPDWSEILLLNSAPPINNLEALKNDLIWTHDLENIINVNYEIFKAPTLDGLFELYQTVEETELEDVPKGYYYKVRARISNKVSNFSNEAYIGR